MTHPEITSAASPASVRIYFDGVLHLFLRRTQVAGIQSWIEKGRKWPFKIEISTKMGDPMLVEYDDEAKWKAVLAEIDNAARGWR